MTVVVDASALVDLALGRPQAAGVERLLVHHGRAVAPDLVGLEVLSALWRLVRMAALTTSEAQAARVVVRHATVRRLPMSPVQDAVWALRDRLRLTDAYYAAWAVRLGVPLLTTDSRLVRAPLPGVEILFVQ